MNIDDALPKSPPDVSVEKLTAENNIIASVVAQDKLNSGSLSTTVPDANVFGDKFSSPLNSSTATSCGIAAGSIGTELSANVSEFSLQKNEQPHLPHEDAEYQQRICGTPELRNHLLTHHSASSGQLYSDDHHIKSHQASPCANNQTSAASIDCMFGAKRAAVFGSEARRTASRKCLLDRSEAGSGGLGPRKLSARRVSFPDNDSELVTGYLEPANPWATGK